MRRLACVLLAAAFAAGARGQESGQFNVILAANYASAAATVELYGGLAGHPSTIAGLRGSRIALATTALIAQRGLDAPALERALGAVRFNQDLDDDVFRMREARQNSGAIRDLLTEVQRRNFSQKVVNTVAQLFPTGARVQTVIPVFFVAFGPQNIDAFVRRVVWQGDTPVFTGEGTGELTIVVNLARAVHYGSSTDERFVGLVSVVAHEVFHAAFGVYKDSSPVWRSFYSSHFSPLYQLLDLTQNEGIAYYLSLVQSSRGRRPQDALSRARRAFDSFNSGAAELLSPSTPEQRAQEIIRLSNTSGYWDNYGAITGMIIARQIDNTLGRQALVETIAAGPADFFLKYASLPPMEPPLPALSPRVIDVLRRTR
jgi:hypothetical protein